MTILCLKELLERDSDMSRSLFAIVRAISLEYDPEPRSIETMQIFSSLTKRIAIEILLLRSERNNLEHHLSDEHFIGIEKLLGLSSHIRNQ